MISLSSLRHSFSNRASNSSIVHPNQDSHSSTTGVEKEEFYDKTLAFYQKCAEVYDYLYPDHLIYSERLFESLLPLFAQYSVKKVLDASCGIGHDMSCLLRYGFEVDGMDISSTMLSEASQRLSAKGFQWFHLRQGDVRFLDSFIDAGSYDLVIFRGNTFSNIRPAEVSPVVEQLVRATRVGGLVLTDYRNGRLLLRAGRRFEFRGFGFNKKTRTAYMSYYALRHSEHIDEPYRVNATVLRAGLEQGFRTDHIEIMSHYVSPERVLLTISGIGCQTAPLPSLKLSGLPCLENVIAIKSGVL